MKKSYIILLHFFFWFYKFGWYDLVGQLISGDLRIKEYFNPLELSHYVIFPFIFYINYLYVLPGLYKKGRYGKSWLCWIGLLVLFIVVRYTVQEVWFLHWLGINNYSRGTTIAYYIFDNIYYGGSLIVMSFFIWLIKDLFSTEKEKMILQRERDNAEVSFLRSQVNPHFIFNTMNNIYSLVYHRSEKALPAIEKLSGIMRYVMKDSNAEKIELTKEVEYLENFIELQSLRIKGEAAVNFSVEGNIHGKMIAPLLLIPFVENGFKHGELSGSADPFVIRLAMKENAMEFYCSNKTVPGKKDESSGIGLQNVKRRLELLYPDRYKLVVTQTGSHFSIVLNLNL
jgi:two-component system, LytTR family, sensor kinase